MRLSENIISFIKNRKPHVATNADIDKRILDDSFAAMDDSMNAKDVVSQSNILMSLLKMKTTRYAVVALTFIAIITGLHKFKISIIGTSIVWADVAERLEKVSSYQAKANRVLTEVGQVEPFFQCDILRYFSPEHGSIEKSYVDGELVMIAYCSLSEKVALIILPLDKVYYRFDLNEELLSLVEYINPANTDGIMELFGSERCMKLGSREIDGMTTEGFEVKDIKIFSQVPRFLLRPEDINIRMWVSEETLLPTRIEGEGFVGKGLMTGFKDITYQEVMTDIEYDLEIDHSIFEVNIPGDYKLIDPANIAEKAELTMFGIVPVTAIIIAYKQFKKRKLNGSNSSDISMDKIKT
jgi:hypothetical protein